MCQSIKYGRSFGRVALMVALLALAYFTDAFTSTENRLQDLVYQRENEIGDQIVILGIEEESLAAIGRWPWDRRVFAQAVTRLSQAGAAVIGLDVLFTESGDPAADQALAQAINQAGNVVQPVYGIFDQSGKAGLAQALELSGPPEPLAGAGTLGHINIFPDKDGVVRHSLNTIQTAQGTVDSFVLQIFRLYERSAQQPTEAREDGRAGEAGASEKAFLAAQDPWGRTYVDFAGGVDHFGILPFAEVLTEDFPAEYFQDKIVLIGPAAVGLNDAYYTPLARSMPMYGVEIHANILQSLLDGTGKAEAAHWVNLLLVLGTACLAALIFRRLPPWLSTVFALVLGAALLLLGQGVYKAGWVLNLFYPLLAVGLVFLLVLAERFVEEQMERRRITGVFGRYVAPQVVKKILAEGEEGLKLGGSSRYMTVLFVDIRGFTPLSEKTSPQGVVSILNEYLSLCADAIVGQGGTLDKFIGDAAMALFNAPLDLEDHAFCAVRAAWAMKQGATALKEKLQERFGTTVEFGIGLNSGFGVVGNIGCAFRMDYTAIGDTVNTAARLESNAGPGQIILSRATYDLVRDKVSVKPLGNLKVKGKAQEIQVFELIGIKE